ncbi:hypothetical protein ACJJTC_006956 [Scirpophaga incertulas]
MGGKIKQSQRTKNNVRPSSSGRSAELLHSTSYLTPGILHEFGICVKRLNKKDPTTKVKALQELNDLVSKGNIEDVLLVLPSWAHFYKILAVDTDCKVREAAQLCHGTFARVCGRQLAPVIRQLVPAWLQAQYDEHAPAASLCRASLQATFPENKLPEVINFCKEEVMSQVLDNIIGKSEKTMPKKSEDPEELEQQLQRLVAGSLQGLRLMVERLPGQSTELVTKGSRASAVVHSLLEATHSQCKQSQGCVVHQRCHSWCGALGAPALPPAVGRRLLLARRHRPPGAVALLALPAAARRRRAGTVPPAARVTGRLAPSPSWRCLLQLVGAVPVLCHLLLVSPAAWRRRPPGAACCSSSAPCRYCATCCSCHRPPGAVALLALPAAARRRRAGTVPPAARVTGRLAPSPSWRCLLQLVGAVPVLCHLLLVSPAAWRRRPPGAACCSSSAPCRYCATCCSCHRPPGAVALLALPAAARRRRAGTVPPAARVTGRLAPSPSWRCLLQLVGAVPVLCHLLLVSPAAWRRRPPGAACCSSSAPCRYCATCCSCHRPPGAVALLALPAAARRRRAGTVPPAARVTGRLAPSPSWRCLLQLVGAVPVLCHLLLVSPAAWRRRPPGAACCSSSAPCRYCATCCSCHRPPGAVALLALPAAARRRRAGTVPPAARVTGRLAPSPSWRCLLQLVGAVPVLCHLLLVSPTAWRRRPPGAACCSSSAPCRYCATCCSCHRPPGAVALLALPAAARRRRAGTVPPAARVTGRLAPSPSWRCLLQLVGAVPVLCHLLLVSPAAWRRRPPGAACCSSSAPCRYCATCCSCHRPPGAVALLALPAAARRRRAGTVPPAARVTGRLAPSPSWRCLLQLVGAVPVLCHLLLVSPAAWRRRPPGAACCSSSAPCRYCATCCSCHRPPGAVALLALPAAARRRRAGTVPPAARVTGRLAPSPSWRCLLQLVGAVPVLCHLLLVSPAAWRRRPPGAACCSSSAPCRYCATCCSCHRPPGAVALLALPAAARRRRAGTVPPAARVTDCLAPLPSWRRLLAAANTDLVIIKLDNFQTRENDWFTWLDKEDRINKRILNLLEKGGWGDCRQLNDILLPLLSNLPEDQLTKEFYEDFFTAFLKGLQKKNILNSKSERQYWITNMADCLRYLSLQKYSFVAEVITSVHRNWLKAILSNQKEDQLKTNLIKQSAKCMTSLVRFWLKQSKENGEKYDQLIRNFWQNTCSTVLSQLETNNTAEDELSVEKKDDKPELDEGSVKRYNHNLRDVVETICSEYFLYADKNKVSNPILNPIITILNEFEYSDLYLALGRHFDVNNHYDLYDKVLSKWLLDAEMECEVLVDMVFRVMKYLSNEELDVVLASFDKVHNICFLVWSS